MFSLGITLLDSLISLVYIGLVLLIAFRVKSSMKFTGSNYFMPFIYYKLFCTLLFVILHAYVYNGGDTFLYFAGGKFMFGQLINNPLNFLNLYFTDFADLTNLVYDGNFIAYYFFRANDVFFMSKLISIVNILSGNNYLASSIIYTMVCSYGVWKLYETLCKLYPSLSKLFAIGVLFYPTIGIWGSGILKDPLTLASVGLIFYSSYNIVKGKKNITSILLITISIYLCSILKPYILYTFVPIMLFWVQLKFQDRINSSFLKVLIAPVLIAIFSLGGFFFLQTISEGAGKYSLDNVKSVAEGFHSWHSYLAETRDQSGYSLGTVEFTPISILTKAPEAFFVTYYRPFLFTDVRNFATVFEALQSFILLIITFYILIKVGIINFLRQIYSNDEVKIFFLFAVIFGVAVGITSYNFGALSRYKIPSLPFYTAFLIILYKVGYLDKKKQQHE